MNKWKIPGLVILSTIILSACSVNSNADKLYKQPKPLSAHVMLPETIKPRSIQVLEVHVMQENKTVDDAKSVQFKVWKKDVPRKVETVKAHYDGSMYKAKQPLKRMVFIMLKPILTRAVNTSFLLSKSQ
ncbi:hypothetical protein [Priestia megaterium]|uniref:hypothetical protein n=1 Tax=Priestia megaterium TaxID=1404 RepID=UPI002079CD7C|nr:hypothetical protein [Priestia megaterium]USL22841.1 hypothetical protein LIT33_16350 [Priestia megaterium]